VIGVTAQCSKVVVVVVAASPSLHLERSERREKGEEMENGKQ